jgi:hypothetical protein
LIRYIACATYPGVVIQDGIPHKHEEYSRRIDERPNSIPESRALLNDPE